MPVRVRALPALAACLVLGATHASAQSMRERSMPPTRDVAGTKDSPALPRYTGSVLIESTSLAFDEVTIPRGTLVRQPGSDPVQNNDIYADPQAVKLEGRSTRLTYVLPPGRSPLEAIRGYQQAVRSAGGQVLFECAAEGCGGSADRSINAGGGKMGLINHIYPKQAMKAPLYSQAYCVVSLNRSNQRYTALRLKGGATAGILAYTEAEDCNTGDGWSGRTVAIVLLGEPNAREQLMSTVSADAMGGSMASEGKVVLYALYFDTNRADLKPESGAQLTEMGRYLKANGGKRVLVVGHTDNQGGLDANVDLSRRRAQAVVDALVRQQGVPAARLMAQGVGMAAPVATNRSDDGRAKNRRVELVEQ